MTEKEFRLTEKEFKSLTALVHDRTGIVLKDNKRDMVYSRLVRRLRQLNLQTFSAYLDLLKDTGNGEIVNLANAITTNLTRFFREDHHFDHVREHIFAACRHQPKTMIWSAGCSSGQEPYSLALTAHDTLGRDAGKVRILATDIDTNILAKAEAATYAKNELEGIPASMRKLVSAGGDKFTINAGVKSLVHFRHLNLMNTWPMKAQYDAIFCRNVLIYFDKATQRTLIDRYLGLLKPGGYLYLGHSESLAVDKADVDLVGRSIFQKPSASAMKRQVA